MDQPISGHQTTTLLKERAQRLGLTWLSDDLESQSLGRRLVLGVAAWSIYDVRLLTLVSDAVASGAQLGLNVVVFDADELLSSAELQSKFPGIGEVFHTPIAGYWEAGQLKETASGFAGRQLVGRLLGFDPKLVLEQPAAAAG